MRRLTRHTPLAVAALALARTASGQPYGPELIDPCAWSINDVPLACPSLSFGLYGGIAGFYPIAYPGPFLPGPPSVAEQVVATTPGTLYALHFTANGGTTIGLSRFAVYWDDRLLTARTLGQSNASAFDVFAFAVPATGTSSTVRLTYEMSGTCMGSFCDDWNGSVGISDVGLTTAPEPATIVLCGAGLLALGVRRRSRR